jgi:hypothetical protein
MSADVLMYFLSGVITKVVIAYITATTSDRTKLYDNRCP